MIRHDVEFSPRRALEIARLDDSFGVESSFLFQVKSNAYNLFSSENLNILQEVKALNRKVGLHLYVSMLRGMGDFRERTRTAGFDFRVCYRHASR